MARPREFNTEVAIDRAMQVFWDKGYEGASLSDLLSAMGIARGSLYKAFVGKRNLYLEALDQYDRTEIDGTVQLLLDQVIGDGGVRIRQVMNGVVTALAEYGDRRGCFLCNSAVDQAPHDEEVEQRVTAMMRRLDAAFADALRDAHTRFTSGEEDTKQAAQRLTAVYLGLRVQAKAGYSPDQLRETIASILGEFEIHAA